MARKSKENEVTESEPVEKIVEQVVEAVQVDLFEDKVVEDAPAPIIDSKDWFLKL